MIFDRDFDDRFHRMHPLPFAVAAYVGIMWSVSCSIFGSSTSSSSSSSSSFPAKHLTANQTTNQAFPSSVPIAELPTNAETSPYDSINPLFKSFFETYLDTSITIVPTFSILTYILFTGRVESVLAEILCSGVMMALDSLVPDSYLDLLVNQLAQDIIRSLMFYLAIPVLVPYYVKAKLLLLKLLTTCVYKPFMMPMIPSAKRSVLRIVRILYNRISITWPQSYSHGKNANHKSIRGPSNSKKTSRKDRIKPVPKTPHYLHPEAYKYYCDFNTMLYDNHQDKNHIEHDDTLDSSDFTAYPLHQATTQHRPHAQLQADQQADQQADTDSSDVKQMPDSDSFSPHENASEYRPESQCQPNPDAPSEACPIFKSFDSLKYSPRLVLSNSSTSTSSSDKSFRSSSPDTPTFSSSYGSQGGTLDSFPLEKKHIPAHYRTNSSLGFDDVSPIIIPRCHSHEKVQEMYQNFHSKEAQTFPEYPCPETEILCKVQTSFHNVSSKEAKIKEMLASIDDFLPMLDKINGALEYAAKNPKVATINRECCLQAVRDEVENYISRACYIRRITKTVPIPPIDDLRITQRAVKMYQDICENITCAESKHLLPNMDTQTLYNEFKRTQRLSVDNEDLCDFIVNLIEDVLDLDVNSPDFDCMLIDKMARLVPLGETFKPMFNEILSFRNNDILEAITTIESKALQQNIYNFLRSIVIEKPHTEGIYELLMNLKQHFDNQSHPDWIL